MESPSPTSHPLRYWTYIIILSLGILAYSTDFFFGAVAIGEDNFVYVWLLMCFFILYILYNIVRSRYISRRLEVIGYGLLALQTSVEFIYLLATGDVTTTLGSAGIWMLSVYVFSFFVFEPKTGLIISAIVFISTALTGTLSLRGVDARDLYMFVKFNYASIFVITFGFGSALWRQYYERTRIEKEIAEKSALTDGLTGLFNRRAIEMMWEKEASHISRNQQAISLIIFDLDNFKDINDRFGHAYGDIVLRSSAKASLDVVRQSDYIGRWGGEEFIVLCPNTNLQEAVAVAERLRQAINALPRDKREISASFGVAERREGEPLLSLTERADQALYKAKANQKNCVRAATLSDVLVTGMLIV